MASVLMIVARDRPDLYDRLRQEFNNDRAVAVVLDRRFGERRREIVEAATLEQRQRDRRRRDVDDGLQRLGWATARTA
jgi:hypothetical protein